MDQKQDLVEMGRSTDKFGQECFNYLDENGQACQRPTVPPRHLRDIRDRISRELIEWKQFRTVREEFDKIPEVLRSDVLRILDRKYPHPKTLGKWAFKLPGFRRYSRWEARYWAYRARPVLIKIKNCFFKPPIEKLRYQANREMMINHLASKICTEIEKFKPDRGQYRDHLSVYTNRHLAPHDEHEKVFFTGRVKSRTPSRKSQLLLYHIHLQRWSALRRLKEGYFWRHFDKTFEEEYAIRWMWFNKTFEGDDCGLADSNVEDMSKFIGGRELLVKQALLRD